MQDLGQATMKSAEPLRIIYICGYGRSGSTILDILLGNSNTIFGAGELGNLPRRVWPQDEYCACGTRVRSCGFWREVIALWQRDAPADMTESYRALQLRQEAGWTGRPGLGRAARDEFARYRELTVGLYAAIGAVSGKRVIVDSTKLPARGLALAAMPEIDLRVIHLVRDGRGVAWSLLKPKVKNEAAGVEKAMPPRSVARTALRWSLANLAAERLCARVGAARSIWVRYEDLIAAPERTLAAIGALAEADLAPLAQALAAGATLRPDHQVAGNRLRMTSELSLRLDHEWIERMPQRQTRAFQLISGGLLRRYGYGGSPARS
jgi:hypothetical protein